MATDREISENRTGEAIWASPGSPEWDTFEVHPGEILEVRTEASEESPKFVMVITEVWYDEETEEELVKGRFIAYTDEKLSKGVGNSINRKHWGVHLCSKSPCDYDVDKVAAHVTTARWFSQKNFECSYLKPWGRLVLKEFNEMFPSKEKKKKTPPSKTLEDGRRKPRIRMTPHPRGGKRKSPAAPEDERGAGGNGTEIEGLRRKLKALKERLIGGRSAADLEVIDLVGDGEESEEGTESPYAQEGRLTTGSHLDASISQLALEDLSGPHTWARGGDIHRKVKMELKDEGKRKGRKKKVKKKKERAKPSRLLAVAEQQEKQKKVRREKERKKGRGKRSSEVRALVRLLEKKETKKKSKDGGGPSESSSSPESSSYEDEESSSESDLKAPLQRKSAKSPGSVMKMLVHHCQEALDQSSAVAVEEKSAVTSGVKLVTYFNLLVRPHFPSTSRDMKEMYMLAVALDLLRCGKLQEVGDALSSRFLAVHCAASEGNWSAAKFLEMYPLEVMQSAPTELLLKARKHHRLIQKSQGVEQSSWAPRFNPGGNWKGGGKDEEKGKGKGKKGKGEASSSIGRRTAGINGKAERTSGGRSRRNREMQRRKQRKKKQRPTNES